MTGQGPVPSAPPTAKRTLAGWCARLTVALAFFVPSLVAGLVAGPAPAAAPRSDALAMHGAPALDAAAAALPYVNPDAPQGGSLTQAVIGSFDSLNPFIVKGVPAEGLRDLVYESLMKRSLDEPFSLYGLLARSVEMPADRSRITFRLRPEARFADGKPVSIDDVIFSLETLRAQGRPNHRLFYGKVKAVERVGNDGVTFILDTQTPDRELPLILGLMPVLPRHAFEKRPFNQTTLLFPLGSGPYRVESIEPGRRIVYARNQDYWGKDLWLNRGLYNFARVRFDYYRDETSAFAAFKAGQYDLRAETDAVRWATAYDFPAAKDGRIVREAIERRRPPGLYALVFNTRRPSFADRRVREALILLFDFPWINRTLLHGLYVRTESYFANSDLAATGPASAAERTLLATAGARVEPGLLDNGWIAPRGDDPRQTRANRKAAMALLEAAGFTLKDGLLHDPKTGAPFAFEILLAEPDEERIALTYASALAGLGITARVRSVDAAQLERRRLTYDFDMTSFRWSGTLSPGNEQAFRWGSVAAAAPGSYNYAGVNDPAVDALIRALLDAKTRAELVTATRALDRTLLSGAYVLPLFHLRNEQIAYTRRLAHPPTMPLWGVDPTTWWVKAP